MKLKSQLLRLIVAIFALELFILVVGFSIYTISQKSERMESVKRILTDLPQKKIEAITFHHSQGDFATRDLLLYKLVEDRNLRSAKVIGDQDLGGCNRDGDVDLCQEDHAIYSLIPLKLLSETVAYLKLSVESDQKLDSTGFIAGAVILLITLALNILVIYLFLKKFFERDFNRLFSAIQDGKSQRRFTIAENQLIWEQFAKATYDLKRSQKEKEELLVKEKVFEKVARMAHDLKNLVLVLDETVKSLSENHPIEPEERDIILTATKRIKDIGDSRLNQVSTTATLLASLIIDSIEIKKRKYSGVEFRLDLKDLPPVEFHESDAFQIIDSIVQNAVEALPNNAGVVEVSLDGADEFQTVVIRDNGKGMSPEDLVQVFEKGHTKGKEQGTGLGLYHAKDILEARAGSIEISSNLGISSEVKLKFFAGS